jgi:N-succinyldiaminopimelate aminotransferase
MSRFQSHRTADFTESVIREMTRLAIRHDAVNLAQGFPDFAAPEALKQAACDAIQADMNQYTVTWGARPLRDAIAAKYRAYYGLEFDPEREITVCCGSTEGMIASLLATTNDGEEIIVFEPFYENYHPDAHLCGAIRRVVSLQAPDWTFDPAELRAAFNHKTKAIILNTPHNPTGKVFSRAELDAVARVCLEHDLLAVTDEVYEHLVFDGEHIPLATLPGMRDRTVTISSGGKTFSCTGWKVGWVCASAPLVTAVRTAKQFLTYVNAGPFQYAIAVGLGLPDSTFRALATDLEEKRDRLSRGLADAGLPVFASHGTYFVTADIRALGEHDGLAFCRSLPERCGVVAVPNVVFYDDRAAGLPLVRFAFCKRLDVIDEAVARLKALRP